jgi:hypothetical protein
MNDIQYPGDKATREQINAWAKAQAAKSFAKERATQDRILSDMMQRWTARTKAQAYALRNCKHTETVDVTRDDTEYGGKAIEGGVETRCVACKRLVAVS